jgi:phosphopantothenoylcysteine decarboxylase/phosphopantothenate--cysteine ligase
LLNGKNIVIGVCGGIAAYKAADLISSLIKYNANVDVIMTKSSQQFISPLTFQTLSGNKVIKNMFDEPKNYDVEHISLAKKADLFVVIPATANIIGKIANGIADDMLTTTVMATEAPILFVPAMNSNMYNNKIVKRNIETLKNNGYFFVPPQSGRLACGDYGEGKLAEIDDILERTTELLYSEKDFRNLSVLVTAGPTREKIDPVRFISNYSSGKMGYSIARAAKLRGADVTLVSGPVNLPDIKGIKTININTAGEMFEAVKENFANSDIVIKSAAVSDYRPETFAQNKIKKNEDLMLKLIKNPDILSWLGSYKTKQILIGFSMETERLLENSKKKLIKKNLDFIVANDLNKEGAGFGTDTNIVNIIDKDGTTEELPMMSKFKLANHILDKALKIQKLNAF